METDLNETDNGRLKDEFMKHGLEIMPLKNRYAIKKGQRSFFYKEIIRECGGKWQTMPFKYDPPELLDEGHDAILPCWTVPNKQMEQLLDKLKLEDERLEKLCANGNSEDELLDLCRSLSIRMEPSTTQPGIMYFVGDKCRYYKAEFKPFGRLVRIEEPPRPIERDLTEKEMTEKAEGVFYWRWEIPILRIPELLAKLKDVIDSRKSTCRTNFKNFHQHIIDKQRKYPDYLGIRTAVNDMEEQFEEEVKKGDFKTVDWNPAEDYHIATVPVFSGNSRDVVDRPLFTIPKGMPDAVPIAKKYVDQLNKMAVRIERHGKNGNPKTTIINLKTDEPLPKNEIVDDYEWTTYAKLHGKVKTTHE
jgi:hypothetical protein